MRIFPTLVVSFLIAGVLSAQEPVITPDMPVTTATLQQWLHSGDPRLVTWAADFARRTHNAAIMPKCRTGCSIGQCRRSMAIWIGRNHNAEG